MAGKIRVLKLFITLAILLSVTVVFLASPSMAPGITSPVDTRDPLTVSYDLTTVPERIKTDAQRLSTALLGDNKEAESEFAEQLLSTYIAAKDREVVILFNPGGWGWRFLSDSPNWHSIFLGMQEDLKNSDVKALFLEYRRSAGTLKSYVDEYMAVIGLYSLKAKALASRINFLTEHIPGLRVILTGESNGTIICDEAMKLLKDNPRVFSIQTGTPFWHTNLKNDRTLIINDNGVLPDTFSSGDFFTIVSRNIEVMLGFARPDNNKGTILNFFAAPGHTYSWEELAVRRQIENFLETVQKVNE